MHIHNDAAEVIDQIVVVIPHTSRRATFGRVCRVRISGGHLVLVMRRLLDWVLDLQLSQVLAHRSVDLRSFGRVLPRNTALLGSVCFYEGPIDRKLVVESEMRGEKRADYGKRLVEQLAVDLTEQFGRGFGSASLWRMRGFYQAWPDKKILATPLRESEASPSPSKIDLSSLATVPTLSAMFPLPWSAYLRMLAVKRPEARNFYEAEAIRAGWSVRS